MDIVVVVVVVYAYINYMKWTICAGSLIAIKTGYLDLTTIIYQSCI